MPDFQYTARGMTGQEVTGVLTAASERDAVTSLAAQQLFPIKIDLADEEKAQQKYAGRRVRARQLAIFYSQLADLLRSGVPLLRSLELLVRQTSHPTLKLVLQEVRDEVADGTRLAKAMQHHKRVFPELVVSMVLAGEEGGFLEDVLKRVAAFTEHQEDMKSRVVGAMAYPLFLFGAGIVIVAIMLVFFVPKFASNFERLAERGQLPWATTTLMSTSDLVANHGLVLLIGFVAIGMGVGRYIQTDAGRLIYDKARLRIKGLGAVVRSLAIARFCRILGTLLTNGVPILQSLRIAKDATGNLVLSQAIGEAADNISAGKSLAQPLGRSGEFPEEVVEMIAVGEEANNLEQVLIDISENMERNTYRQLDLFVRLLEPMMLMVMAGLVLFVVIGLLLPIFQSSDLL